MRAALLSFGLLLSGAVLAQGSVPAPVEGHARLAGFVGKWTLKGMEDRFRETCEWYEGRFHVVCRSENTRADGTVGHGLSILGYIPLENAYTYHGIGARGRNVTQRGRFIDGVFEFTTPAAGSSPAKRIRLGPFTAAREFPVVEEEQASDGSWKRRSEGLYLRLD